jgi:hypothetical protein
MHERTIERAYESIRGYLPEDASQVLSEQIPRIGQFIDDELTKFGRELADYIAAEVDRVIAEATASTARAHNEVVAVVGEIRADVAAGDATLERAVARLERSLEAYDRSFEDLGDSVRESVMAAVRAAGVPVPGR